MSFHLPGPRRYFVLFLVAAMLLSPLVLGEEAILISSPGCIKCAAAERVLEKVLADYPRAEITTYLIYSDEGRNVIREHNVKGGVPAIVIGDEVIAYKEYHGDEVLLEKMIKDALALKADSPKAPPSGEEQVRGSKDSVKDVGTDYVEDGHGDSEYADAEYGSTDYSEAERSETEYGAREEQGERENQDLNASNLSPATVFVAGFLAGFNPCLLAVLAFLTTAVISSTGKRRDLFLMIVSFSFGIFAMYYLFGAGLLRTLQGDIMTTGFRLGLTVILLGLGLIHIEDARRLNKGARSLFKSTWSQKYIESAISQGKLSTYFLLGALFSLVKAPCVGAVYIVILGLIAERGYASGAHYLLLYNLGVIIPVILLGGIIALGMSPDQVDRFRKEHRAGIRLATGLTLIALAPLIYWQVL